MNTVQVTAHLSLKTTGNDGDSWMIVAFQGFFRPEALVTQLCDSKEKPREKWKNDSSVIIYSLPILF